jgi:hypothetical protein
MLVLLTPRHPHRLHVRALDTDPWPGPAQCESKAARAACLVRCMQRYVEEFDRRAFWEAERGRENVEMRWTGGIWVFGR